MRKSLFAGLLILDPEDSLYDDNRAFVDRDREEIDRALEIGVKTHRHTGLPGLSNPTIAPSGTVVASGGQIAPGLTVTFGYTLEDDQAGETLISPLFTLTTPNPLDTPSIAPSAVIDYTAGDLLIDTYYYGVTWLDASGGETPIGPGVSVEREPGFPNARVNLSQLTLGMGAVGAVGYRLYRAVGGGEYNLLHQGDDTEDTFTDDGSAVLNCDVHPPTDNTNTTNFINRILVQLPSGGNIGDAELIDLYATFDGSFTGDSLLGSYPVSSAGQVVEFTSLNFLSSSPPDVNRSYGGASKIDPDTDILDWHWKRPVATVGALGSGELGDVRLVTGNGHFYKMLQNPSGLVWTQEQSGGGGGGSGTVSGVEELDGLHHVSDIDTIQFVASGSASVGVEDIGGGSARVTIFSMASGAAGPAGPTGPEGPQGPPGTGGGGGGAGTSGTVRAVEEAGHLHQYLNPDALQFVASGSATVGVENIGGGSARITFFAADTGVPGPKGDPGTPGSTGGTGPQGPAGPGAGASGTVQAVEEANHLHLRTKPDTLQFTGSGAVGVRVADLGGGSAEILIGVGSGITALENWHVVGDPGEVAFGSAWAQAGSGYLTAAYRKEGDLVRIRGAVAKGIQFGTAVEGETIFTLPAGYRPPARVAAQTSMGGRVDVLADGTVIFVGGEAYQSLDGLSFSTVNSGPGEMAGGFAPIQRRWASATINLSSGASGVVDFTGSAAGERLLKISTNRRARVRMYGDSAARVADHPRAPSTDPTGDHGVLLDYMNTATASGAIGRVAPHVDVHNLDDPALNKQYLSVMNYDLGGNVVVAFLYVPTEVV